MTATPQEHHLWTGPNFVPGISNAVPTLRKGSKVYIDGFSGLIAGRVIEMVSRGEGQTGRYSGASVKVTARTGRGYVRGEIVVRPVSMVVPRECVRRRKYGTRILPYQVTV